MVNVLFVCLGNICRSPSAEGVFRSLVHREGLSGRIGVDSAGTHAYHIGKPPDPRAIAAARRRGIDLSGLRARQARREDFRSFDLVLAMDANNVADLQRLCPPDERQRLRLFLDTAGVTEPRGVPDPYYDGPHAFEAMLDLIETGAEGLLDQLRRSAL